MKKLFTLLIGCLCLSAYLQAQVNTVEFGKNRVQYQKFNWKYYQTENFNTYFSQDGLALGKFIAQIAEQELPQLEEYIEYGLQRRANIVIYNNFDEYQQSNIGIGIDWQNAGGVTKLVNNKMLVYFDGNHENLKLQIRQGIAKILVDNVLFGDDLGEFAANQALLDLPKWLTDGYIAYAAENWSAKLDDDFRGAILSGNYKTFYHFAFEKPLLAGHAFWNYFASKYGKNKTTYFLYLARIYRNLNNASNKITKKKFKVILQELMRDEQERYFKDIRGRRNAPKGTVAITEVVGKKDYYRFNANPVPRNFSYAMVEFKQGKYSVVLVENFTSRKTLLKFGARSREDEVNPNLPILAWDNRGTRLACIYNTQGKLKLFVYDLVNRIKYINERELTQFDQVQDMKYMLDANTLILSAVKSGQSDIFVYKLDKETVEQITNDVYDDLDASFVAFPNKTGIIYASNRPNPLAASSDDSIAAKYRFNIFLVDNWNKSDAKQISQLTNMKYGTARYPSQYNTSHFTFMSNENGVNNRYAGFFTTERAGLDTLVFIGDEMLRNPSLSLVDSTLKEWDKTDVDSIGFVSVTNDSTYVFPLTNYQSSMLETRSAGDNSHVSETVKVGDMKLLYRLRVDESTLRRRNVQAKPTEYMKQVLEDDRLKAGKDEIENPKPTIDDKKKKDDFFQTEFDEKTDSAKAAEPNKTEPLLADDDKRVNVLRKAKLYEYRPPKYFTDYVVSGFNNTVLTINKFQPYGGGAGPIYLSNGNDFNGMVRMGTSDLFEDYKFTGGYRLAGNLNDNDVVFAFMNQRKRFDWGFTIYRSSASVAVGTNAGTFPGKQVQTYYLANLKYPLDKVRSIRATIGPRFDRLSLNARDQATLNAEDLKNRYGQFSLEYVHDDVLNPALNIWKGLRYKIFADWFTQLDKVSSTDGRFIFNFGFDARHYLPIYRNIIWAVRGAGDFSWGNQKVIYYVGGVDNWFKPKFNNANTPDPDVDYAYQSLALNLRGFTQNAANGNNAVTINSEIRVPVFASLLNKPINNAFLRNFQIVQFFDLGTAWNGSYDKIERPSVTYADPNNPFLFVKIKTGGIGPFAGGYGFGARSTILGYFLRVDAAWEMNGFFRGKPMWYFAMGVDF
jgi:Tol biopolymer transport system component